MKVTDVVALLLCIFAFLTLAAGAWAGPYKTVESSSPQEIVSGMSKKATRGVANVATGWLEFPKQIYVTSKEDGPVSGIFIGPLKGVGMTILRTVSGAAELLTFFSAYPNFYAPYFEPAFVWQEE